jgi:hypothetical protein
MSLSRNQFTILAIAGAVGVILYFGNIPRQVERKDRSSSEATNETETPETNPRTFAGYECTGDCSGHEAGYAWAEEHNISDGDECDTAGEHSNSPSFAEGCHAYVDGDADSEDTENPDNEN